MLCGSTHYAHLFDDMRFFALYANECGMPERVKNENPLTSAEHRLLCLQSCISVKSLSSRVFEHWMNEWIYMPADTKSIVQTHTPCATHVDKNRKNRTFYSGSGGWTTGLQMGFQLNDRVTIALESLFVAIAALRQLVQLGKQTWIFQTQPYCNLLNFEDNKGSGVEMFIVCFPSWRFLF